MNSLKFKMYTFKVILLSYLDKKTICIQQGEIDVQEIKTVWKQVFYSSSLLFTFQKYPLGASYLIIFCGSNDSSILLIFGLKVPVDLISLHRYSLFFNFFN